MRSSLSILVRLLQNTFLYFIIMPTAWVAWGISAGPEPDWSWLDILGYFAFTAPILPWVVFLMPLLTLVGLFAVRTMHSRGIMTVAGFVLVSLPAVVVSRSIPFVLFLGAGGALYGLVFRLPARRTV